MKKFKFAALAAGFLLQSLAHPATAPSHDSVNGDRPASASTEASRDYFLIPDINDLHRDDCPRPD